MSRLCLICNKVIVFRSNNAKCCSDACTEIAKKARSRVQAQNKKLRGVQKLCKRCQEPYNALEYRDARHCKPCADILNITLKKKVCMHEECNTEINSKQKRCHIHQQEYQQHQRALINKKLREETKAAQAIAKEKGITEDNHGIDAKFLVRGRITYEGYTENFYIDKRKQ